MPLGRAVYQRGSRSLIGGLAKSSLRERQPGARLRQLREGAAVSTLARRGVFFILRVVRLPCFFVCA